MKLLLAATLVAACGPGIKQAPETPPTQDFATKFATAARAADVATLRAMMGPHVTLGGLWFPDATCQQEFAGTGDIAGGRLDELARCLTSVKLMVSQRKDSLPDVSVLTYDPGLEIEARFIDTTTGPWLSWIGYESRKDLADALPTITPEALEGLRTAGLRDPAVATPDGDAHPHAWVKMCIDAEGKVTGAHVRQASSPAAARAFTAAIADWTFKPFVASGQPMPACAMVLLAKPLADALPEATLPLPTHMPGDRLVIAPTQLHRTAGNMTVTPDDKTRRQIQAAHIGRLIGTFQFCISEAGRIGDLTMLRSTGVPAYDGELLREISRWEYAPYIDEGKPVSVCTAVTFIYSQR
jgi:hypothetical protein